MIRTRKNLFLMIGILGFLQMSGNSGLNKLSAGENKMKTSSDNWKAVTNSNPISPNVFCADPTAIEYEGRLYVYGTNDHQQYLNAQKNTYEKIKSLVCFSTDDMVNWTYHGEINVGKIEPYIMNSWAPSICKRVEADGLTHFYIYFSNSGCGVGVITSTSPVGPWTDPLGHPVIKAGMPGLNSPAPFDPGVCIDDEGTGWLAFGGGVAAGHTRTMPGSSKIIRLGPDMVSVDSDFVDLKAPHFFEASELNFINGTYVYTYNTDWENRSDWPLKGTTPATTCSMCYMTTKTPLDSDSWVYQGQYFKNPGEMGLNYSNNHTHYEKYQGEWYLFYHTLTLQEKAGTDGGFRSLCVDKLKVDEEKVKIAALTGTRKGVSALKNLNPFENVRGTTVYTNADMWYENAEKPAEIASCSTKDGAWMMVKNADFASGAESIVINAKGSGVLEVRLDKLSSNPVAVIQLGNEDGYAEITAAFSDKITGVHDVYFVFGQNGTFIKNWVVK